VWALKITWNCKIWKFHTFLKILESWDVYKNCRDTYVHLFGCAWAFLDIYIWDISVCCDLSSRSLVTASNVLHTSNSVFTASYPRWLPRVSLQFLSRINWLPAGVVNAQRTPYVAPVLSAETVIPNRYHSAASRDSDHISSVASYRHLGTAVSKESSLSNVSTCHNVTSPPPWSYCTVTKSPPP
jgi:hypothetical protein